MKSMASNGVWDLVELPDGSKPIRCKWVFKTKRNSNDQVEMYKLDMLPNGLAIKKELITRRHSILYPQRILLELLWRLWRIMTWSCIRWMSKLLS